MQNELVTEETPIPKPQIIFQGMVTGRPTAGSGNMRKGSRTLPEACFLLLETPPQIWVHITRILIVKLLFSIFRCSSQSYLKMVPKWLSTDEWKHFIVIKQEMGTFISMVWNFSVRPNLRLVFILPVLFLITMAATAPAIKTPRRTRPAIIPMVGMVGEGGGSGRESRRG